MASPKDITALRIRIITHMNKDHARSLQLYARHYNHLPATEVRIPPKLTEITPNYLILTTSSPERRLLIPLEPPLPANLSGARERLVSMHNTCLTALNLSDIVITEYRHPTKWWEWSAGFMVLLILLTFPFRSHIHPDSNSLISKIWSVGGLAPWHAKLAYVLAPLVLPAVWIIHVGEVVGCMLPRLRKYGVEAGSRVWWCWMGDCFLEGGGAWLRVDGMVREAGEKKAQQKH
ncbi:uncharacterized protein AB675_4673 [Cyphellophora attinorum]|uniref:DUF2470 domain-containing protein n=1 Tax=Cyphellophora attinorum TaxID=1664694 RepID=A0A0N0NLI1_9EURO|nr:uncharacterized protein AB675_4673 [Phialophora attinorum]KPI39069.1 hypothetical protein AB675_4673 [Phialophora attinorum]